MVEESSAMYLSLDRFQRMKFRRMKILLKEIEEAGEMPVVVDFRFSRCEHIACENEYGKNDDAV